MRRMAESQRACEVPERGIGVGTTPGTLGGRWRPRLDEGHKLQEKGRRLAGEADVLNLRRLWSPPGGNPSRGVRILK